MIQESSQLHERMNERTKHDPDRIKRKEREREINSAVNFSTKSSFAHRTRTTAPNDFSQEEVAGGRIYAEEEERDREEEVDYNGE